MVCIWTRYWVVSLYLEEVELDIFWACSNVFSIVRLDLTSIETRRNTRDNKKKTTKNASLIKKIIYIIQKIYIYIFIS